jgi:uroporphyrinogen decarboxylase
VVQDLLSCREVGFEQRVGFVRHLGLDIICLTPTFEARPNPNPFPLSSEMQWEDMDRRVGETDLFVFIVLDGSFGWGMRLFGFEKFFHMLSREASDLFDFIQAVEKLNLEASEQAVAGGAMGVVIADDIAYQRGLMVHPAQLRKHFFPSFRRQVAAISKMNVPVFFHSDGDLNEVLPDVAEAGFDGLHCIEPGANMNIGLIKERYGSSLCLWGNLDPIYLVMPRSSVDLLEQVNSIVSSAGTGGGFIFGSCSGLFKGVRPDNLRIIYGATEG